MEDRHLIDSPSRKSVLFGLFAFYAILVHTAEGNYDALYKPFKEDSEVLTFPMKIELTQQISYYGHLYSVLHIAKGGLVSFGEEATTFKRANTSRGYPELHGGTDKPFIAPFNHDGTVNVMAGKKYQGKIYFQKYHKNDNLTSKEEAELHKNFLTYLGSFLSHAVVVREEFYPTQYLMFTWENVTDFETSENSCQATEDNPCHSSTFQLVIASDDRSTFAIFNYAKMDIPYHTYQFAGMNGGSGRGWRSVVKCTGTCLKKQNGTHALALLPRLQGCKSQDTLVPVGIGRHSDNIRGRFIYLVSMDFIYRGGCLPPDDGNHGKVGDLDTVEVSPTFVDILGGQLLLVSGLCQENQLVYCRFNEKQVTNGALTTNKMGRCATPRLLYRGPVKVEVSSDGKSWSVYTTIFVMPYYQYADLRKNPTFTPLFSINPSEVILKWDHRLLIDKEDTTVDIVLVQYTESPNKGVFKELKHLVEGHPNNGHFSFDPNDIRYSCQDNCENIHLGVIEIRLSKPYIQSMNVQWYTPVGPIPLGWYVNRENTKRFGEKWPEHTCKEWSKREAKNVAWMSDLPPCPCTLEQALADWGRWQTDYDCIMFDKTCRFDIEAKHCVRSAFPTSSSAGSVCCYDDKHNLMHSGDFDGASASTRAHVDGSLPFNETGRVPFMSYYLHDMLPYFQCCLWTDFKYCKYYTDRRPTRDCKWYEPPGSAIIYGDPHVTTFDSASYHFGGAGEFWLIKSPNLSVQAQFVERKTVVPASENAGKLKPTYIFSVAVRGDVNSDIVTFNLAPLSHHYNRTIDIRINNVLHFFGKARDSWQEFRGISVLENIYIATRDVHRSHRNYTVVTKDGSAVLVAEKNKMFHVVVTLPPYQKTDGKEPVIKGLLGTWDENKDNDYMTPDGNVVPSFSAEDKSVLYKAFALKWRVNSNESFFYPPNADVNKEEPYFGPAERYLAPDQRPKASDIASVCGSTNQLSCVHDYYVTRNKYIAIESKRVEEMFSKIQLSLKKIWSCGWLNIPFAVKDNTNYTAGNTVRVTGCRKGSGSSGSVSGGPTEYKCIQNKTNGQPYWEPSAINSNLCTGQPSSSSSLIMIIGIVATVVVLVIVVVVIVVLCRRRSKSKTIRTRTPAIGREDRTTSDSLLRKQEARNDHELSNLNIRKEEV